MKKTKVDAWRDASVGPMQVVSGDYGRERVHYEAPAAENLDAQMRAFLECRNKEESIDPIIKAALVPLWFVTIHPLENGNGRIARAIADMALARYEGIQQLLRHVRANSRGTKNLLRNAGKYAERRS
jgi:Fic family protein